MIEDATVVTTEGLEALVSALSQVGSGGESDQVRVDQLAVLERVKSAVAAAQVRVTAAFVDSQEQVAQAWSRAGAGVLRRRGLRRVAGRAGAGPRRILRRRERRTAASDSRARRRGAGRRG